ncbi:MAG: phosphatase PAP2 family protein [Terriglobales bacterium]
MTSKNVAAEGGRAGRLLVSVACVAAGIMIALDRGFYVRIANDVFFSILMASAAIVVVHVRPWREVWQLAVGFGVLVAGQGFVLRAPIRAAPAGAALGIASFVLLGLRRIWSVQPEEKNLLRLGLLPPLLLVLLGYFSSGLLASTGELHPKTLDLYLYAFDGSLGMQPSFAAGRVVLGSLWLTRMCLFWYRILPAVLMLVYAQQLIRRGKAALSVFLAFFLAGPVGIIFYNLFPACGPIYLFPQFPSDPMTAVQVRALLLQPVLVTGNRNAFPSLHMAWALLAWWYGEGLSPWVRTLVVLFLAGTVLATLGLGEHYFIDLVAAFPFALMMYAACTGGIPLGDRRRFLTLLSALLGLTAWMGMLRFGTEIMRLSPLAPWALVACTVACCIVWQARLPAIERAVEAGPP